jgi:phenylalanyl-tRNA synthetase beta chain
MLFPESWLREFVNPAADRDELCRRLTMAGLEVENVHVLGAGLDGVVVGEIVHCAPHPNADKLRVCQVAIGKSDPLAIVCGAPNAREGLKAPLAMIGAVLPNGVEIKRAALRGVESNGMLCSAKELGLDADASGLLELPGDAPVGAPLAGYLGLPDAAIELKLTPNRPDCLGMRGLAYDVGALFGQPVTEPAPAAVPAAVTAQREVRLEAGKDCPRYFGRIIQGIDAMAKSPLWMANRLRRSGVRPIGAVVDVVNYVMLELGQPMHAYDSDKLNGAISVRRGRLGEVVTLLDGSEIKADPECLLIADEKNTLGLAGIMGGWDSRVTDATHNIFLEAAHFDPAVIMGRARRFSMHTDASHRFERGVDPQVPGIAIERATALLLAIVGGRPGPAAEAALPEFLRKPEPVTLRRERLKRVLGMSVADDQVVAILRALGMRVESAPDGWRVTAPSRRFDIAIEEDLIEEVVRVHGYERVPMRSPSGELRLGLRPEAEVAPTRQGAQLAARGYRGAICYSFVARELLQRWSLDKGAVALANPLSADLAVMRTSLLPGLVEALKHNLNRQQERVRLFESGLVFSQKGAELCQDAHLAIVACGRALPESWSSDKRELDFFDVKADIGSVLALAGNAESLAFGATERPYLHPGRSAEMLLGGQVIGVVGGLHPRLLGTLDLGRDIYIAEVNLAAISAGRVPKAHVLSHFPSLRRDLAVLVPDRVSYASIQACVRKALGPQLAEVVVFDQYLGANLGPGTKSLAIGLILQDDSRTLTDADADRHMAQALAALESECQARLRG